jgi:conjugal transfer pilus assembly protein TraV
MGFFQRFPSLGLGYLQGEVPAMAAPPAVPGGSPALTPAAVLRIWVAPWVDTHGHLHAAGYVFTEVTPRRWTLGLEPMPVPARPHAVQIEPRMPAGATPPATGRRIPGGRSPVPESAAAGPGRPRRAE